MAVANYFSKGQALALFQGKSAELTAIAALSPSNGQFIARRAGAWAADGILSADLTTALTTPPAIGGTTPAAGSFLALSAKALDTTTNNNTDVLTLDHDLSSGSGANNIAAGILFKARTSTTGGRLAARLSGGWGNAVDASRTGILNVIVYNVGTPVTVLTLTPTTISGLPDTDTTVTLGRLRINGAQTSDNMYLAHFDMSGSSNFAVRQDASGATRINAASGQSLSLAIANAGVLAISANLFSFLDAYNFQFGTTTGTKIGTGATQKFSFWNATPIVQPSLISNPSGGATQDAEARTAITAILTLLKNTGLMAAA